MKTKLCDVNAAAVEKLPGKSEDKSGIGVHYVDAYLKPMNVKLEDGTAVKAKRRGLKIALSAGTKKGEGLMRRLEVSADPVVMLDAALQEAAKLALGLKKRPDSAKLEAIAERWRPWRGVAARMLWAYYRAVKARSGKAVLRAATLRPSRSRPRWSSGMLKSSRMREMSSSVVTAWPGWMSAPRLTWRMPTRPSNGATMRTSSYWDSTARSAASEARNWESS